MYMLLWGAIIKLSTSMAALIYYFSTGVHSRSPLTRGTHKQRWSLSYGGPFHISNLFTTRGGISHEFCHTSSCLRAFITVVGFFICEWPHLEKSHIALFLLCNKITVHIEFSWTSNLTSPGGVHVKKGDQWPPTLAGPLSLSPHMAPHRPTDVGLLAGPFFSAYSALWLVLPLAAQNVGSQWRKLNKCT